MSASTTQLQAHYDLPIHNRRIRKDGTIEDTVIETHYLMATNVSIREEDDWLTVTMDYRDIEMQTRIPLEFLRQFLSEYDVKQATPHTTKEPDHEG